MGITKEEYDALAIEGGLDRKGFLGEYNPSSVGLMAAGRRARKARNAESLRQDIQTMVNANYGVVKIWERLKGMWGAGQLPWFKGRRYKGQLKFMHKDTLRGYMNSLGIPTNHQIAKASLERNAYKARHGHLFGLGRVAYERISMDQDMSFACDHIVCRCGCGCVHLACVPLS